MRRYLKAILAAAGGLASVAMNGVVALGGLHVDPIGAGGVCTLVATLAVLLGPANTPSPTPTARRLADPTTRPPTRRP